MPARDSRIPARRRSPEDRIVGPSRLNELPLEGREREAPEIAHVPARTFTPPDIPIAACNRARRLGVVRGEGCAGVVPVRQPVRRQAVPLLMVEIECPQIVVVRSSVAPGPPAKQEQLPLVVREGPTVAGKWHLFGRRFGREQTPLVSAGVELPEIVMVTGVREPAEHERFPPETPEHATVSRPWPRRASGITGWTRLVDSRPFRVLVHPGVVQLAFAARIFGIAAKEKQRVRQREKDRRVAGRRKLAILAVLRRALMIARLAQHRPLPCRKLEAPPVV